jgi:hypothetical protein
MHASHGQRMDRERTLAAVPRRYIVAVVLTFGCGPAQKPGVDLPPVDLPSAPGEWVDYRFSGSFTSEPVTLHEQVLSRDGGRLTLDVTAKRGSATRHWIQVGPDTPDARFSNTADEVYVVSEGTRQRIPNPENATLARFYEWVLLGADATPKAHESGSCEERIGKKTFACTCERATRTAGGKVLHTEESRCPMFPWQRGPARWTSDGGQVVWQVEVVRYNL